MSEKKTKRNFYKITGKIFEKALMRRARNAILCASVSEVRVCFYSRLEIMIWYSFDSSQRNTNSVDEAIIVKLMDTQMVRNCPDLCASRHSPTCSQEPTPAPYPEPVDSGS
jgi:hypothetical protein